MKTKIAQQFKQPQGLLGLLVGGLMKKMNQYYYEKLIGQLEINDNDHILEIGFGPGGAIKTIGELNSNCKISGIDFSELMYKKASKLNENLVRTGRLELNYGDFLTFNFGSKKFTKIFCVNVVYFWDDLTLAFKKIFDLLEPNGVYAFYMTSAENLVKVKFTQTPVFNKYSIDYVKLCLQTAGFSKVEDNTYSGKGEFGYFVYASKI